MLSFPFYNALWIVVQDSTFEARIMASSFLALVVGTSNACLIVNSNAA